MSRTVKLEWRGPYTLDGQAGDPVFTAPDAGRNGIYLFAVEVRGRLRVEYVGETGRTFLARFTEHTCNYLGGVYRIWDPKRLADGKKVAVWEGLWKKGRKNLMAEFLADYPRYAAVAREVVGMYRVFLAPVVLEKRDRQRVEAALALEVRRHDAGPDLLIDGDLRLFPLRTGEEPMDLALTWPAHLAGLAERLTA